MCGVATHAEGKGYAGYGLLRVGFEVPRNSQVGCVAQPRTRLVGYAGYGLLYHPPTEAEEVLEALVNRRNQLVDMRTAEKNRLHQVHETQVESVKQLIAHFDRLIDELDKQIDEHTHTHFDGKAQVAEQIKGIGSITTATLMEMLPELGRLNHKRIASLVGIAPHPRESGETKFKSRCFGGRSAVRKALYMGYRGSDTF